MSNVVEYVIRGIPFGCVYALVAMGLVLAYRTSGVFNLAFGAQAFAAGAVFYQLRVLDGWPLVVAAGFVVLVLSPALGLVLERFVFRALRGAPPINRLVVTTGLAVAIPALVKIILGNATTFGPPVLWTDQYSIYRFGSYAIDAKEAAIVTATVVVVVLLGALLRFTPFGLVVKDEPR